MLSHGVTFNLGSAKVCSHAIIETCFSHDKDIWIPVTGDYIYFYLILLFLIGHYTSIIKLYSFIILVY